MPRVIDQFPEPATEGQSPKIFVLSTSRSGTLGLYKAFKMLGYRPYHVIEIFANGLPHLKVFHEALKSTDKPYGRAEFDKWFAGYDVIVEVPSYLQNAVLQAYSDEPDVKFILTERDPDAWVRSVTNTIGVGLIAMEAPGVVSLSCRLDAVNREAFPLIYRMHECYAEGKGPKDPGAQAALRRHYIKYIAGVKAAAPPGKLHVIKLEEGLNWESICPFLGCEIPSEPYPRGNDPTEFHQILGGIMAPGVHKAIVMCISAVVVPLVGLGAWMLMKSGPLLRKKV